MNTLIFLCGAGCGAFLATMIEWVVMVKMARGGSKQGEEALAINRRNAELLEQRNVLGRREVEALEKLAEWANHNFHPTKR